MDEALVLHSSKSMHSGFFSSAFNTGLLTENIHLLVKDNHALSKLWWDEAGSALGIIKTEEGDMQDLGWTGRIGTSNAPDFLLEGPIFNNRSGRVGDYGGESPYTNWLMNQAQDFDIQNR